MECAFQKNELIRTKHETTHRFAVQLKALFSMLFDGFVEI